MVQPFGRRIVPDGSVLKVHCPLQRHDCLMAHLAVIDHQDHIL